ncbi:hypothetical protein SDC9_204655 [bioreactor metagenome]|uniref:Uncharacterized protein n=1 Tax=bioreactor metagenome TaxID=1076179 RepID=A0A645J058_9ZZZZ
MDQAVFRAGHIGEPDEGWIQLVNKIQIPVFIDGASEIEPGG